MSQPGAGVLMRLHDAYKCQQHIELSTNGDYNYFC